MIAQATTIIDVWRDATDASLPESQQTLDEWGDEVDTPRDTADSPYLSDIPASIIEKMQRRPDPDSGDLRTVRYVSGRVGSRTDIRPGDRVKDRKDGSWYAVREAMQPQNTVMELDIRLDLERTSSDRNPSLPIATIGYGVVDSSTVAA